MKKKPSYLVRPSTAVLTRGFDPSLSVGSARPAVFRASTYVFSTPEAAERAFDVALHRAEPTDNENVELIYCRLSHPNAEILEDQIVPLEPGATAAAAFNSGMAAISTAFFTFCKPGSAIVYTNPVYGGTHHLIHQVMIPLGVECIPVAAGDTDGMTKTIANTSNLSMVFVETPANPTLRMSDISAAVSAAKDHPNSPLVAVDNTFMGPAFQHPLTLKADLSIYSATKFLSGFSDMLAGVVLARDRAHIEELQGTRAILGNILQPDQCWLLDSRLPTVLLRMNRQSKHAERIAERLAEHPKVHTLIYPGHFSNAEQIRIRDSQCKFPGALFSILLKGGKPSAFNFLRNLRIGKNAVSLGGMETLVCHPASTTHSEMTKEEQVACGISDDLVRISIGLEDWQDLLADFTQALDKS